MDNIFEEFDKKFDSARLANEVKGFRSGYKYPDIPEEYYDAVMYACEYIRETGWFNKAIEAAVDRYGVDEDELKKYVRARQAAGQKGRKYRYYILVKYNLSYDLEIDTHIKIAKATSLKNIKSRLYGFTIIGNEYGYASRNEACAEVENAVSKFKESLKKEYAYN